MVTYDVEDVVDVIVALQDLDTLDTVHALMLNASNDRQDQYVLMRANLKDNRFLVQPVIDNCEEIE